MISDVCYIVVHTKKDLKGQVKKITGVVENRKILEVIPLSRRDVLG